MPIFRKSSHTMFSSYSRPGLRYITFIGISAQFGCKSWVMENPMPPWVWILRGVKTKTKRHWCWAGFGIGTFGGGPKGHIPFFGLYTSHAYSEIIAPHKIFALHRCHRTAQRVSTHTQKSSHSTKSSYTSYNGTYFIFPEISQNFILFLLTKMAWNHVFLEYGEDGVPTWDISSLTYYRIPCRFCS